MEVFIKIIWIIFNSEPKDCTEDKFKGNDSRGVGKIFNNIVIIDLSEVKAEGEEFNVLISSYTRKLSGLLKETKDPVAKRKYRQACRRPIAALPRRSIRRAVLVLFFPAKLST